MPELATPTPSAPAISLAAAVFFCVAIAAQGGCASSALDLAPESSSTPFKPTGDTTPTTTASGARDFGLAPAVGLPLLDPSADLEPKHLYTLAELIDIAQTTNPETRSSWELARQAALAVGITKALYLPVVTATVVGGYQHFSQSGQVANLPSTTTAGDVHGTISGVALQWLLFDFGERDALTRAATDLSFASNIAFNGTHQKIIYDVSRAFYEYTAARQRVTIARQTKVESGRIRDAARARFARGIDTSVEVAQADQLFVQSAFDLVQAEGAERDSYHSLLAAVGIGPTARIQVQNVAERPLSPSSMMPIERYLDEAIASRPDVQAGFATSRASHESIAAAEAEFLPKVFMTASGTYLTGALNVTSLPSVGSLTQGSSSGALSSSTSQSNATVLGGVSVPLYDGGVRGARLLDARSRTDAAEANVVRLQQSAAAEIVSADDALRSSLASYQAATALVHASATTEDATFSAYKSGFGTLTAAIDAEKGLLAARLAQAQAHGIALIAASSLAFLTGRLTSSDALAPGRSPLLQGPLGARP